MRPHISINVKNVAESVAFYQKVFGVAPQKQTGTYAKFDLKEPALNFAMQSGAKPSRVSHLGIEVDSAEEVAKWETRLKEQGLLQQSEKDSTCCYARQDKAWFTDPDGNNWEVFFVHEQLPVVEKNAKSCCG
jgi:catechol 2,3-dioxygenase-like lactoylglutathione lyase family enzyme